MLKEEGQMKQMQLAFDSGKGTASPKKHGGTFVGGV